MSLKIGSKYILRFLIKHKNKELTYTAEIISEDEKSISFKDKLGKEYTYSKELFLTAEEVKE